MPPRPKQTGLLSLKSRYIWLASLISVLLVSAAVFTSWYAQQVTAKNTQALKLRDQVTASTIKIRNHIWASDIALNTLLIRPSSKYTAQIASNLDAARELTNALIKNPDINTANLLPQITELQQRLGKYTSTVSELIKKREDPNWVYPVLPYINSKLLLPNIEFETAVTQALREIAIADGRSYASPLYGEFDEVRDLWRRKILNFRAVVIRFAGLNEQRTAAEEDNIETLHEEIEKRLQHLQELSDEGKLGLESEFALEQMRKASKEWQKRWETVKNYRSSDIWRSDLHYMQTIVRPVQQELLNTLAALERGIQNWSKNTVDTVQKAAWQISIALWALSTLAIVFVVLIYILVNRTVLRPISYIASMLTNEGEISVAQLQSLSSKEIQQLVNAFEVMRRQVHQRQVALEYQALHDSLTGLPNRTLLHDRLEQSINLMNRNKQTMALMVLDLDRFKDVNDALGHHVGDQLLQQVGQRLMEKLRDTDTVARLGGDEFAIVAPNADLDDVVAFAEKIVSVIKEVYVVDKQNLYVGASIGIAMYPEHGKDAGELIRHADIAMYHAKRNNLGFSLYDQGRDEEHLDKLALVGELHKELSLAKNLRIAYQPLIDVFSHQVVTVEVLLRWHHPDMGAISPEQVISMAEHTGLIGSLTEWILETALRQYTEAGLDRQDIKLAVNLSAWNLQDPALPEITKELLQRYGLKPDRLIFEITESAMMSDPVHARKILYQLSSMGIELSIDDFGTGFSSLGYLKMLPVNSLKIDKSFVIDMLADENDALIVQSTIDLAHNLGLVVIAEGVETQKVMQRLRILKCDIAQGYHIAGAMYCEDLIPWLKAYKPKLAQ
ncbi:MAG: EAL domain-containing protein [Gammaproteobacteria bacterium]|nr:EAL domain-containing protein [Gammaproteobacteria bacterium]